MDRRIFTIAPIVQVLLLLLWPTSTPTLRLVRRFVAEGFVVTSAAHTKHRGRTTTATFDQHIPKRLFVAGRPPVGGTHAATTRIPICEYHQITIPSSDDAVADGPRQELLVHDLTGTVQDLLQRSGMDAGTVTVISRHTTTSIVINEYESRLARDIAETYQRLIPPDERSTSSTGGRERPPKNVGPRYRHNDIEQRPESVDEKARCIANGWDITNPQQLQAWRDQEPINAHSHLLAMLLGSSECIPVANGTMVIGQWQSILLLDLDGPRNRTVGVQLTGFA